MKVETSTMVLFWNADNIFSNWHPSKLELHGHKFKNAESAFMYLKAEMFNDTEAMARLPKCDNPAEAKKIGRGVKNFNNEQWDKARYEAMKIVLENKFFQNENLAKVLAATGEKTIVEASPLDKIWGIGLAPDDVRAQDPKNWKGQNLLGLALMEIRAKPYVQKFNEKPTLTDTVLPNNAQDTKV